VESLPEYLVGTGGWAYFNVSGKSNLKAYSEVFNFAEVKELEPWIPKVKDTANQVKKIYGYFNNHFHGYAPKNCLQLIERSGLLSKEQEQAKKRTVSKQANLSVFFG
jgi:uncharacterized protein YecE (DUF72 family)